MKGVPVGVEQGPRQYCQRYMHDVLHEVAHIIVLPLRLSFLAPHGLSTGKVPNSNLSDIRSRA